MSANPVTPIKAENLEATLRQYGQDFVSFFQAGDADALAALYAPNATLLPPNSPSIEGRDAIRTVWQTLIGAGFSDVELELTRLEVSGDLAVELGRYRMKVPQPDGSKLDDRGKYQVTWKRQPDGDYRMLFDMFSSDLPPAG